MLLFFIIYLLRSILIFAIFRPLYSPALSGCLSNSVIFRENRTKYFIWFLGYIFIRIPILVAFDSRLCYISAVLLSSLPQVINKINQFWEYGPKYFVWFPVLYHSYSYASRGWVDRFAFRPVYPPPRHFDQERRFIPYFLFRMGFLACSYFFSLPAAPCASVALSSWL